MGQAGFQALVKGRALGSLSVVELVGFIEQARLQGLEPADERAVYLQWLDSSRQPGRHLIQFNLGSLLQAQGLKDEARAVYGECLITRPLFAPAAINLGLLYESAGHFEEAIGLWKEACEALGEQHEEDKSYKVVLFNHMGRVQEELRRYPEALECLEHSLRLDPDQADPVQHWVHIRQRMCAWPVHQGLEQIPFALKVLSLSSLTVLAFTDDPAVILMAARETLRRKVPLTPSPRWRREPSLRASRLRVGYLSGDLCTHAVGVLLPQFLAEHDRDRIELYGYDYSIEDSTTLRLDLIQSFDKHRSVHGLTDEQVASLIRKDEVDVLIDLHGLSYGARPDISRLRPAPLQGTYLGYMGTTGMPWLDFVVADRYVLPDWLAPWFVERPLYVEGCFLPLSEPVALRHATTKAELGIGEDRILLAAVANAYKLTPEILAIWFGALRKRPDAVLWMIDDNPAASARIRLEAGKAGVSADQLLLRPRQAYGRFVSELALADLLLDTFPYNCGSTARDAVMVGVPLLTCSGRSMVSRMGGSLVHHTGLGLPIANDLRAYERTLNDWLRDHVAGTRWSEPVRGIGATPAKSLVEQLIRMHSD